MALSSDPLRLTGVIPILATPFHDDETLDHASLTRTIQFVAATGVSAVTLLGVLGESNRMTDAERSALIRIFAYYSRVADNVKLPIVLQDHPASTEVHMATPLILRLVREIPSIACIKAEAVPSPGKIAALRKGLDGRPMPILTGLGGLYGFFDLERGSDGFNTGFAFPEVLLAITERAKAGDLDSAYAIYRQYLPLMVFEQQPGLAVRKEILRRRGLLTSPRVRHPGGNIDPATAAQVGSLLERSFPGQDLTMPVRVQSLLS